MKNLQFRKQGGITLIALVITIIVLLILAGVAISMLTGENGILRKAADAKEASEKAAADDLASLKEMELLIKTNGQLKIGDTVAYTPQEKSTHEVQMMDADGSNVRSITFSQEDFEWKYMGVSEDGRILLASNTYTQAKNGSANTIRLNIPQTYTFYEAYEKGPQLLDDMCNGLYSGPMGTARNMKIEDVNKLLGYTANEVYYKNKLDGIAWTSDKKTLGDIEADEGVTVATFKGYDKGNAYKDLKSGRYVYNIDDYKNSAGYNLVTCGPNTKIEYWLSSPATYVNLAATDRKINFMVMHVSIARRHHEKIEERIKNETGKVVKVTKYVDAFSMLDTSKGALSDYIGEGGYCHPLRPVVQLNTNVELTGEKNENGAWTLVEK